MLDELRWTPVE